MVSRSEEAVLLVFQISLSLSLNEFPYVVRSLLIQFWAFSVRGRKRGRLQVADGKSRDLLWSMAAGAQESHSLAFLLFLTAFLFPALFPEKNTKIRRIWTLNIKCVRVHILVLGGVYIYIYRIVLGNIFMICVCMCLLLLNACRLL